MAKLIRWLFDGPYRRALPFWKAGGDDLLYRAPLTTDSVVVDAGAYTGGFSERIARTWGAQIWAFEPVPTFHAEAVRRLEGHRATVLNYGLSSSDSVAELSIAGDGSSAFAGSGAELVEVEFRDAARAFDELGFSRIDLLAINIEGAEYDLLDRLLETGWLDRVEHLLVQFHPFVPKYRKRYAVIAEKLRKSHNLEWRFPLVWEAWRRIG